MKTFEILKDKNARELIKMRLQKLLDQIRNSKSSAAQFRDDFKDTFEGRFKAAVKASQNAALITG